MIFENSRVKSKIDEPTKVPADIDESKISEIIRQVSWGSKKKEFFSGEELLYELIKLTKCDLSYANAIVEKMKQLGLGICQGSYMIGFKYDLWKFAQMRGYISEDEISLHYEEELKKEEKEDEREKMFIEKYGPHSNWSDDIWEEYEEGNEDE